MKLHTLLCTALFGMVCTTPALVAQDVGGDDVPPGADRGGKPIHPSVWDETKLGLDVYTPRNTSSNELLHIVREMTDTKILYYTKLPTGVLDERRRDRFVQIRDAIGVQDFDDGRKQAIQLLKDMDDLIGQQRAQQKQQPEPEPAETTIYRPKALAITTLEEILLRQVLDLSVTPVHETNSLLLSGTKQRIDHALALLRDIDQAGQQFLLHCLLVEADPDPDPDGLPQELRAGLAELMPGVSYDLAGSSLVRGSVAPTAQIEVRTKMGRAPGPTIPPPQFEFSARPTAYDSETGTLSLRKCQFELQQPMTQVTVTGGGQQVTNFSGYSSEHLGTDLSLRRDEYAVIGALGSDQKLIVLRFEAVD